MDRDQYTLWFLKSYKRTGLSRNLDKNLLIAESARHYTGSGTGMLQNRAAMRKKLSAAAFAVIVLLSVATMTRLVSLGSANPYMYHKWVSPPSDASPLVISVSSPENNTVYRVNDITLAFNITTEHTSIGYLLGANFKASWMTDNVPVYVQNIRSPEFPSFWDHRETFRHMPDGEYSIVINASGGGQYADGLTAYLFDMTTISVINFTVDTNPPEVSILSMENKTYDLSDVPLNFTVSERASLIKYSLDGQDNSTLYGNTTLAGLPNGRHNLTVYVWDVAGNLGVSEIVVFNMAKPEPEPFPAMQVVAVSVAVMAMVGIGLLVYLKKRNH